VFWSGRPKTLKVDNGPVFADRKLDQWAHMNGVQIDFSRPGKPTDNAPIEALDSRLTHGSGWKPGDASTTRDGPTGHRGT